MPASFTPADDGDSELGVCDETQVQSHLCMHVQVCVCLGGCVGGCVGACPTSNHSRGVWWSRRLWDPTSRSVHPFMWTDAGAWWWVGPCRHASLRVRGRQAWRRSFAQGPLLRTGQHQAQTPPTPQRAPRPACRCPTTRCMQCPCWTQCWTSRCVGMGAGQQLTGCCVVQR